VLELFGSVSGCVHGVTLCERTLEPHHQRMTQEVREKIFKHRRAFHFLTSFQPRQCNSSSIHQFHVPHNGRIATQQEPHVGTDTDGSTIL
jgi:hypothetical protein